MEPPSPLDACPTIDEVACYLWHAVAYGAAPVSEAIAWADALVAASPEPPLPVVELSLCVAGDPGDALHRLARFGAPADHALVFRLIMARAGVRLDADHDADAAASLIYRFLAVPPPIVAAQHDLRAAYDFDYSLAVSDPNRQLPEVRRRIVGDFLGRYDGYRRVLPAVSGSRAPDRG